MTNEMQAEQLLGNLADGQYDDEMSGSFSFLDYLKVFHPREYEERSKKVDCMIVYKQLDGAGNVFAEHKCPKPAMRGKPYCKSHQHQADLGIGFFAKTHPHKAI